LARHDLTAFSFFVATSCVVTAILSLVRLHALVA